MLIYRNKYKVKNCDRPYAISFVHSEISKMNILSMNKIFSQKMI